MHAICELQFVKINEQSDGNVEQLEVTHELRLMEREHLGDSLGFDQNAAFNQNIETEGSSRVNPL